MTWRGLLRSMAADARRAEREARRRQRELERQQKQLEKMLEQEQAAYEVEVYENRIDLLMSVHKDCGEVWDWVQIQSLNPPDEPTKKSTHEEAAQTLLDSYKPGVVDKLLGRVETKREELVKAVEDARQKDEEDYQDSLREYEQKHADWQALQELAKRILAGDPEAFDEAIQEADPFSEISEIGSSISFQLKDARLIEATLQVNSEEVIPQEVKTQLKSGKLSVKKMPKTKFYELYQDYVCGCVLRIARELFALLPIEMTIVTATGELLNTKTGHMENQPILSVAIPRKTLERLNFEMLDPSDAVENFVHQMKFLKTKGFKAVEKIKPSSLQPG